MGHMTDIAGLAEPCDEASLPQIGHMTHFEDLSRREKIAILARRHRIRPNKLYKALEDRKKSVKEQKD